MQERERGAARGGELQRLARRERDNNSASEKRIYKNHDVVHKFCCRHAVRFCEQFGQRSLTCFFSFSRLSGPVLTRASRPSVLVRGRVAFNLRVSRTSGCERGREKSGWGWSGSYIQNRFDGAWSARARVLAARGVPDRYGGRLCGCAWTKLALKHILAATHNLHWQLWSEVWWSCELFFTRAHEITHGCVLVRTFGLSYRTRWFGNRGGRGRWP